MIDETPNVAEIAEAMAGEGVMSLPMPLALTLNAGDREVQVPPHQIEDVMRAVVTKTPIEVTGDDDTGEAVIRVCWGETVGE